MPPLDWMVSWVVMGIEDRHTWKNQRCEPLNRLAGMDLTKGGTRARVAAVDKLPDTVPPSVKGWLVFAVKTQRDEPRLNHVISHFHHS